MTFFTKAAKRSQTEWGKCGPDKTWLAYIDANIQDEVVIEQAKKIVDRCSPQRYGPNGTNGYSFFQREYLLNLLLFHYADHGFFPSGHICITDEWIYQHPIKTTGSTWFCFKSRSKVRRYEAGWWIKIPSLDEIEQSSSKEVQP